MEKLDSLLESIIDNIDRLSMVRLHSEKVNMLVASFQKNIIFLIK